MTLLSVRRFSRGARNAGGTQEPLARCEPTVPPSAASGCCAAGGVGSDGDGAECMNGEVRADDALSAAMGTIPVAAGVAGARRAESVGVVTAELSPAMRCKRCIWGLRSSRPLRTIARGVMPCMPSVRTWRRRAGLSDGGATAPPCRSALVGLRRASVTGHSRRARSTRSRADASGSSAGVGCWSGLLWAGISHATANWEPERRSPGASSMLISKEPLRERMPLGPRNSVRVSSAAVEGEGASGWENEGGDDMAWMAVVV